MESRESRGKTSSGPEKKAIDLHKKSVREGWPRETIGNGTVPDKKKTSSSQGRRVSFLSKGRTLGERKTTSFSPCRKPERRKLS